MVRRDSGLTLIELLIALALSSILVAALYQAFIGEHKAYTAQERVADMQQNLRVAIDRMTREIRMAGYRADILASVGNIHGFREIITPRDNANNVGQNDDQITVIIEDKAITYRLESDAAGANKPVLIRAENKVGTNEVSEVLADNIENLQFRYTLKNGTVLDSPGNSNDIRMVMVTITARTESPDPQLSGDGYRRRVLSSLTKVRNLGS
jgi:type IV pilus assembly protein PilW